MARMNGKRILAAGAAAGLVVMIGELLLEPLAGTRMEAWLAGLGLPQPGEVVMLGYLAASLALGITVVWLYAALTPQLGAGPGAALRVGIVAWVLACIVPNIALVAIGVFPITLFGITATWSVLELIAATQVGAWIYRKNAATAAAGSSSTVSGAAHI